MPFHISMEVETNGITRHRWSPDGDVPTTRYDSAVVEMSGIIDLVVCTVSSDGEPAIRALDKVYGNLNEEDRQRFRSSPHVGIGIHSGRRPYRQGDYLLRNVLGVDRDKGVVAFLYFRDDTVLLGTVSSPEKVAARPRAEQKLHFVCSSAFSLFLEKSFSISSSPHHRINDCLYNNLNVSHHFFTIGQRKGIKVADKEALYVIKIDAEKNEILVGSKEHLGKKKISLKNLNLLSDKSELNENILVKVRSTGKMLKADINLLEKNEAEVNLLNPENGISPGQACVFYKKDQYGHKVLGGGWIKE